MNHDDQDQRQDLLSAVLDRDNLARAWHRVKSNKGAPGIDGVRLADWPEHARAHWPAQREQIQAGRYRPQAVRRVDIPKPDGGRRPLGIPTVTDRVVQQAIAQVLTPIFDPTFSDSSFGFRPGRNAHQAIRQVQAHVQAGYRWAVDIDLAKFFDTVNHDLLMSLLGRAIADKRLLHLLDQELERRGHRFARYADDMIILVKSERAAKRVMQSLTQFLQTTLKLTVNLAKSKVAPVGECSFLGFVIVGKKIRWTPKSLQNFKHRVRELTGRSWGVSMEYRLRQLSQYLRGWFGYFGISQYYRPIPELDEWLRRRLRMCYWKQWRWARTKIRHMLNLGVALKAAIQHGVSSLSYWRMARTPVTQQAMSNAWLKAQGLLSIKDLWCKAQGYRPAGA